jgi:hypothetical protein
MVWAAILYAGAGAAASHQTALWLYQVIDAEPDLVHVSVPTTRRVDPQPGVRIHRTSAGSTHPALLPPRSRIEVAVLDHANGAPEERALDLVLRATQRRLTTPARLREALSARSRHSHRSVLIDVLAEAEAGVHSMLERHYLRDVERAHGLPTGRRNRPEKDVRGRTRYRDVRYPGWSTIVELDGRAAHAPEHAARDRRRDNSAVIAGDGALKFGWSEVVGDPCGVAADVCAALRRRGWSGTPTPCGPECTLHLGP